MGLQNGELEYLKTDKNFESLQKNKQFLSIIGKIEKKLADKKLADNVKSEKWVSEITANAIQPKIKKYNTSKSGFALYYSQKGNITVPFLVYIPKTYNSAVATNTIVFLHGGVKNTENFNYDKPEVTEEPIFKIADKLNSIVIYPFGKKDFGWVNQEKAFENILDIIEKSSKFYNINKKKIYLGGMSNGGTATFWFASQKPNRFAGFYAISANPELEFGKIDFNFDKPFYEIHSKDDDVFKFNDVEKIYSKNRSQNWHFKSIEDGGHGFIYSEKGQSILFNLLSELMQKK